MTSSVQIVGGAMYTAVPKILVTEWCYVYSYSVPGTGLFDLIVVSAYYNIFWINYEYVYMEHSFGNISNPVVKIVIHYVDQVWILLESRNKPASLVALHGRFEFFHVSIIAGRQVNHFPVWKGISVSGYVA